MLYTFDSANANAPSKRDTQYFEMVGNRAIYHDGWVAATTPPSPPWELGTGTMPPLDQYQWELYHIAEDYSEYNDLAASNPDKLKEMQALFLTEAGKYQVFPLDNSGFVRLLTARPSAVAGKTDFTYTGVNPGIPVGNAPSILDKDYTITAEVTIPSGGAEGMIATIGGRFGGYALMLSPSASWLLKRQTVQVYRTGFVDSRIASALHWHSRQVEKAFRLRIRAGRSRWTRSIFRHRHVPHRPRPAGVRLQHAGPGALPLGRAFFAGEGKHTIVFDFKYDGPGPGKGGTGVLSVDGKEVDRKTIEHTIPLLMPIDETLRRWARHPHASGLYL